MIPVSKEELRGACARGYCYKVNENKILDPELLEAIVEEVWDLLSEKFND